ncbi:hypothetical protein [Paenibacillus sp. MMS20-IR301]|uniref:hypothetical protein n=1 Tax=Paenibacillus sp. MMS20-IR301 TaxID=2895946 RepID=UPI0028F12CAB|nr:hypothetical protein [Paenibacillus sp. MMS20-IR301]WNS42284.1 hypothetical protein LOS79_25375 [Paenibacillus sp. MMS20-IR301]
MKEDNRGIAIYHVVKRKEGFEKSAEILFTLVKNAQEKYPNKNRMIYLDIEGHKNKDGGFDHDLFELQKEFILGFLMQFISEVSMPLGRFKNENQKNDVPDGLNIMPAKD